MLADVVPYLACPTCRASFIQDGGSLVCPHGHRFDVARQGYVNLLGGGDRRGTADTAEMVADRCAVLGSGLFAPVAEAVASAAAPGIAAASAAAPGIAAASAATPGMADAGEVRRPLAVDLGAGTGYYLSELLATAPQAVGLAIDLSKHAARRAAAAHHRLGAVVADVWRPLPVVDAAASVVLNVFAPRRAEEIARLLRPDGVLVVVVPAPDHLTELVGRLGLLTVDDDKLGGVQRALQPWLRLDGAHAVWYSRELAHTCVLSLVGMGPSAWHTDRAELSAAVGALEQPVTVTLSMNVLTFRHAGTG